MSACQQFSNVAAAGVAPALRAVDCLASETTAAAFGRLFGGNGALVPALTALLTLYIAFFAFSLLTGRSRVGISALTPRMMTLGLVLTFATSWIAYQSVVWNLAVGGPDQIASVLTGARGSATQIFADRIDLIFGAIAEVAEASGQSAQGAGAGVTSGSFTPANVMWLGALLLLLGTVGVLVTSRIALAVLLAVGPAFVVFALFRGTRGLTAGWLRGLVLTAITPLFVVVGGGIVLELIVPVVAALRSPEGALDGRAAIALFLAASVHVALMSLILKVAGTTVSAWRVFGLADAEPGSPSAQAPGASASIETIRSGAAPAGGAAASIAPHARTAALILPSDPNPGMAAGSVRTGSNRTVINNAAAPAQAGAAFQPVRRTRGLGSRYPSTPVRAKKEMIR
ncbi:type IV secretion system protein VirB6 [Novosphingobium kunmingense]|uniref:Type IV secretion system protein VirB6 n=1 Tax=Novosphingobium kunmingense TaxID=1211806 RepID=A0A2N0HJE9_9SPHN|nr:type IV secretion system protein [Novosphingobium kunmingense]PKB19062.1 type IV secretion system protein VirB6 [Novosphingobium kunmingense]